MNEKLPTRAVEEDQRLDADASNAQAALAAHRWHWTLDESNPERVSIRAYARAVHRSHSAIKMMVNGYVAWTGQDVLSTISLPDAIAKAGVSVQRATVAEAIAKAKGIATGSVLSHNRHEIREVLVAAEDAAERRGTSIDEEIPRVVETQAKTRALNAKYAEQKRRDYTTRFDSLDGQFADVKRRLNEVLEESAGVEFTEEQRDLLRDSVAGLTALLRLIDLRLGGAADVDWDSELAKLA